MVIDERAFLAIKAVTYLSKKGGVSNCHAAARSVGVKDEALLPVFERLAANKLLSIDECEPYPILRLIMKSATAYEIIEAAEDMSTMSGTIETFTVPSPAPSSRWSDVYRKIRTYKGKPCEELKDLTLLDLTELYSLTQTMNNSLF